MSETKKQKKKTVLFKIHYCLNRPFLKIFFVRIYYCLAKINRLTHSRSELTI